jgi:hypothetical protein
VTSRLDSVSIGGVRNLRQAADTLVDTADRQRAALIRQLGLKRYIFNALGQAAHEPAAGCRLEWPDRVETVNGARGRLGEYLYARAQEERQLPQAVVVDGEKYYL